MRCPPAWLKGSGARTPPQAEEGPECSAVREFQVTRCPETIVWFSYALHAEANEYEGLPEKVVNGGPTTEQSSSQRVASTQQSSLPLSLSTVSSEPGSGS